jgi:acyl dehydratase
VDLGRVVHARRDVWEVVRTRRLEITEELIRAYSRRGNYHSDASISSRLALPGLIAQGMQAAGPAYGVLIDEWGDEFLAHGEIDLRFVGVVLAGDTVEARVEIDADAATIEVVNLSREHVAVVGRATRTGDAEGPRLSGALP